MTEKKWVIQTGESTFLLIDVLNKPWEKVVSEVNKVSLATYFNSKEEAKQGLINIQKEAVKNWFEFDNVVEEEQELEEVIEELEMEEESEVEIETGIDEYEDESEAVEEYENIYVFKFDRNSNPSNFYLKKLT